MAPHRLGGAGHGGGMRLLGREERLEKLLASQAYGGAVLNGAEDVGSDSHEAPPPCTRSKSAAPASRSTRPSTAGSAARCGSVAGRRPPAAASSGRRPGSANIHTLSSGAGGSGSRLHQTTEAYRQQRGTTARTVEEVGRATMTREKACEVDRARAKVHGEPTHAPRGSSGLASAPPRMPLGPGQRLGAAA
eukprot:gnl/TRDRNA2_/TRDRNA2_176707_c5_seq1.p1 gnl/TRDRNA2_/TRDRNA2_176707_c5~~gnl/TRDRNA2_/TRDRNA2_176707_c5_seq1.p1  ORF type:complete len:191 (-),score=29.77 gnl/TRDRNA2_/TRDRNA2_176707_c5_seq1:307-879(-)